jgi:GntR family transcriptional regulator / MocR family aminotransferase
MAETWAKGLDLHVDLTGTRIRAQLESGLREAIRSGRLRPETRLPSSRTLAADLGVARNTVAEVYSQLVAEGWLAARTGSGTVVASPPGISGPGPAVAALPGKGVAGESAVPPPRYDLRSGTPDLSSFPRREWLAAARRGLADAPDQLLGYYGDPRGAGELRTALAEYLARARGVHADPDRIVICAGFRHGLALVCRALLATGCDTMAVEEYGHRLHRGVVAGQGLKLRLMPVDGSGAVLDAAGDAGAMLLTPAHQFPLGVALSPARRRALAGRDGIVIEDDYDGEFRYDRQPVGAMQALAPDRVVYAGTASKSLAPGVRLGWLVVPPQLLEPVLAAMTAAPSVVEQLALASFITSGDYDRHIRRARLTYRRRRDKLIAAMAGLGLRVAGIAAGLQANLEFEHNDIEDFVTSRAAQHGVAVSGLREFTAEGASGQRAGLVVGYGRPPEHAYMAALARLTAVLSSLPGPAHGPGGNTPSVIAN